MNIVICEDSISDRHKLEKVITKVLIKNNLNSEIILSTNNSADVLNYANKNNQITLYFLDINLHEKFISGIDIANVIRETDEISPIVLITNYSDKLSLTFEYKLDVYKRQDNNRWQFFESTTLPANTGSVTIDFQYMHLSKGNAPCLMQFEVVPA